MGTTKEWRSVAVILIPLAFLLAFAAVAHVPGLPGISQLFAAQEPSKPQPYTRSTIEKSMDGKISLLEADGTITVRLSTGRPEIVYARDATKIYRNGKKAKFRDLRAGDAVSITYILGSRNAVGIRATGP